MYLTIEQLVELSEVLDGIARPEVVDKAVDSRETCDGGPGDAADGVRDG